MEQQPCGKKRIFALVVSSFGFTSFDSELVDFNFHLIVAFHFQFVPDVSVSRDFQFQVIKRKRYFQVCVSRFCLVGDKIKQYLHLSFSPLDSRVLIFELVDFNVHSIMEFHFSMSSRSLA